MKKAKQMGIYTICFCLLYTSSNISELPGKVLVAYTKYEASIVNKSKEDQLLNVFNPLKPQTWFYRYTIASVELVDKNFTFEEGWKTKLALVSSEQTQESSYCLLYTS